jgi:hypothetical protein
MQRIVISHMFLVSYPRTKIGKNRAECYWSEVADQELRISWFPVSGERQLMADSGTSYSGMSHKLNV